MVPVVSVPLYSDVALMPRLLLADDALVAPVPPFATVTADDRFDGAREPENDAA